MSVTALAIVLLVAFGAIAVVCNHVQARLALVELALNEGLPPGYEHGGYEHETGTAAASTGAANPANVLPGGVHVFLSRNCHACQRLVDELDQVVLDVAAPLHLRYVDRPRPIAAAAANRQGAALHKHQNEVALLAQAGPLPFTVSVGDHGLTSRAVTPTVDHVLVAARDAGIAAEIRAHGRPIDAP